MAEALKIMDDELYDNGKHEFINGWVEDLQEPSPSDEELALEVNALEIDPDARVVLTEQFQLPVIDELQAYFGFRNTPERIASRQRRAELEAEDERWCRMKFRYDEFVAAARMTSQYDTVPNVSDLIIKNRYYLCLGGAFMTPGEFYVNSVQSWNPLEGLMEKIQNEYKLMDKAKCNFGGVWKGHLQIGFIVGARYRKDMEFHRAKIIGILGDDNYKVQFLDYGDIVVAPFKEMRYLPLKYLQKMEFQAIRCTLQHNVDVTQPWTKKEGEYFRKLVFGKTLAIHFKNKFKVESGTAWKVDVHFYDEDRQQITDFHVERQVFKNSGRNIPERGAVGDTTNPKVAITNFNFG